MKKLFSRKSSSSGSQVTVGSNVYNETETQICGYRINEKKLPPLHKAVLCKDIQKVSSLGKKNIDAYDYDNRAALHLACALGYGNVVQELLNLNARVNVADNNHDTPLLKAVQSDSIECIQLLCHHGSEMNCKNKEGNTGVHLAVQTGHSKALDALFNAGASLDCQNNNGETALHIAFRKNDSVMTTWLLENGANLNIGNKDRQTVLMLACRTGHTNFVSLYLENHPDTLLKDTKGLTAIDHATLNSKSDCLDLVTSYQEKFGIAPTESLVIFDKDLFNYKKTEEIVDPLSAASLNESWNSLPSESQKKPHHGKKPHLKHFMNSLDDDDDVKRQSSAAHSAVNVPPIDTEVNGRIDHPPPMLSSRTEAPEMPEDLVLDATDWNNLSLPLNSNKKVVVPPAKMNNEQDESDQWDSDIEEILSKKSSSRLSNNKSELSGTPRAEGDVHSAAESSAWDSTALPTDVKSSTPRQNSENPVVVTATLGKGKDDFDEDWDSSEYESDNKDLSVHSAELDNEHKNKMELRETSTSPIITGASIDWTKAVDTDGNRMKSSQSFDNVDKMTDEQIREETEQDKKRYKSKLEFDDETILKNEKNLQERMKMKMKRINTDQNSGNENVIQSVNSSKLEKSPSVFVDPGCFSSDDDLLQKNDFRMKEKEYEEQIAQLRSELELLKERLAEDHLNKESIDVGRHQMESLRMDLQTRLNKVLTDYHKSEQTKSELEETIKSQEHDWNTEKNNRLSFEKNLKQTTEKLQIKEDECFHAMQELQKKEKELRNMQLEQKGLEHTIKRLETEKKDLKRRIEDVTCRTSLDSLTSSDVKFKQPLLIDSRSDICLKQERDKLEEENEMLERCLQQVKNESELQKEALEQASLHYTRQINQLKGELEEIKNNDLVRSQIKESQLEEIEFLRKQLEESQNALLDMKNTQAQDENLVHQNLSTWTNQLHLPSREIQQLRDTNRKLIAHVTEAENSLARVKIELESTINQLSQKSQELRRLKKDHDHKKSDIVDYKQRIEIMEAENQDLADKVDSLGKKLSEVYEQSTLLHHHLELLIDNLIGKYELSQEDIDKLNLIKTYTKQLKHDNAASLPDLRDELDRSASVIRQLQNDLKNLKEEHKYALDKIAKLEMENSSRDAIPETPVIALNVRSSGEGRPSSARSDSQFNDIIDKLSVAEKNVQTNNDRLATFNDDEFDRIKARCLRLELENQTLAEENQRLMDSVDNEKLAPLVVDIQATASPHLSTLPKVPERYDLCDADLHSPLLTRPKSTPSISRSRHSPSSDILLEKLRVELDRSIAKHLEAGTADKRYKQKGYYDMFNGNGIEAERDNSFRRSETPFNKSNIDISYTAFLQKKYLL